MSTAVAPPRARKARRAQPRDSTGKLVSRLNRKVISEITGHISEGASLVGAAALAGVPARTFWAWVARGRNGSGSPLEIELAELVQFALDRFEGEAGKRIWGVDDWRAWKELLQARFPDRWAPIEKRIEHSGRIKLVHEGDLTPERFRAAMDSGRFTAEEVQAAARFLEWVRSGEPGATVDGEVLEIEAGEEAEAA